MLSPRGPSGIGAAAQTSPRARESEVASGGAPHAARTASSVIAAGRFSSASLDPHPDCNRHQENREGALEGDAVELEREAGTDPGAGQEARGEECGSANVNVTSLPVFDHPEDG